MLAFGHGPEPAFYLWAGAIGFSPFGLENRPLHPCRLKFPLGHHLTRMRGEDERLGHRYSSPIFSAWMNASWGISTLPNWRMRFLPRFWASSSLRLRVASPP